jgi:hypothetical protein
MSASVYESLCTQVENALRRSGTGLIDKNESDDLSLSEQLVQHGYDLKGSGHGEASMSSCVAAILKHDLVPLHVDCGNRHASGDNVAPSKLGFLPSLLAQVSTMSMGDESFLLPLRDCLLKHDYVSFLLSRASQNMAEASDTYGDWETSAPICGLAEFIIKIEGAEIRQVQQDQPRGSINRGASTVLRSPQPGLINEKLVRFLLQRLSLALREVLPTDQAPPGALANFSQRSSGQLLGGSILNSMMTS